jgi:hypothetical protein
MSFVVVDVVIVEVLMLRHILLVTMRLTACVVPHDAVLTSNPIPPGGIRVSIIHPNASRSRNDPGHQLPGEHRDGDDKAQLTGRPPAPSWRIAMSETLVRDRIDTPSVQQRIDEQQRETISRLASRAHHFTAEPDPIKLGGWILSNPKILGRIELVTVDGHCTCRQYALFDRCKHAAIVGTRQGLGDREVG